MRPLNSMVPDLKKSKKELKDEDYNSLYTQKFYDYQPPLCHIHSSGRRGNVHGNAVHPVSTRRWTTKAPRIMRRVCSRYSNGVHSSWTNARICCQIISALYTAWSIRQICRSTSPGEMLQHDRHLKRHCAEP